MIINLKIYYYSVFDKGNLSIKLNENNVSVKEVLVKLDQEFGEAFEKKSGKSLFDSFGTYFNSFLNGEYLNLPEDYKRKISDHDTLIIIHPVSGG